MSDRYCLRWNNHQSNMISIFHDLLKKEAFTDVTLAVENHTIKCHKLILAACSPYLQKLLEESPCKHPTIILKDIKYTDLQILLDFMYNGEVSIMQDQLGSLLKTAEVLKVKGLVDINGKDDYRTSSQLRDVSPPPAISTTNRDTVMASSSSVHSSPPHSTFSDINQYLPRTDVSYLYHSHAIDFNRIMSETHPESYNTYSSSDNIPYNRKLEDTPILRTALGQNSPVLSTFDSAYYHIRYPLNNITSNSIDLTHRREAPPSPLDMDEEEKKSPKQRETTKEKSADLPKPEWKRYKQYSRAEIDAAITAVREGMSAVQAARKYNVPSRTLYDKVKKLGITRVKRSSTNGNNTASSFYDTDDNLNGIYNTPSEADNEKGCNVKKIRQDHDSSSDSFARCVISPVIRYATQMQQLSIKDETGEKYEVEDLSMPSRKLEMPVTKKPSTPPDKIKEETLDTDQQSDNDQN